MDQTQGAGHVTSASPRDYDYDSQGRIAKMTIASGSPSLYGFDASGNATTLPTGASATYDNGSELTASTLSGITTTYTYDSGGSRTQTSIGGVAQTSAGFNGAREVTSYTDAAASMTSATYDGDGLRTAATNAIAGGSPVSQNYLWDTNAPDVPTLLDDGLNAYVYAGSATPIEQVNLATGTAIYLFADQLGSVRATVTASGAIGATANYDAWGNPDTAGGLTQVTPFGYSGAYTDPTGLSYLIHRYYDPGTASFLTVDPSVAETEQAYAYADDDPTDYTDLSGLDVGGVYVIWDTVNKVVVYVGRTKSFSTRMERWMNGRYGGGDFEFVPVAVEQKPWLQRVLEQGAINHFHPSDNRRFEIARSKWTPAMKKIWTERTWLTKCQISYEGAEGKAWADAVDTVQAAGVMELQLEAWSEGGNDEEKNKPSVKAGEEAGEAGGGGE